MLYEKQIDDINIYTCSSVPQPCSIPVSTETLVGEYQVMKAPLLTLQLYFISTAG